MNNEYKLTKFVQAAGWAAKMGSADLKQTLCNLNGKNEQVLIGFDTSDDAGVFKLSDDLAIVQTSILYISLLVKQLFSFSLAKL